MLNVRDELRYAFTALGYFTRVPVPRWVGFEPHYPSASARYFPLVGALVGAIGALVYLSAQHWFAAGVAVLLSMIATLLLTGALHEDGLADCCDGFGGGRTRDDVLRIMRDSRIGAFGAIGLIVCLALKWQTLLSLAAMSPARAAWTMVAAHAASRAYAISYLLTLDYQRPEGKAQPVSQRMSGRAAWVGALSGVPWLWCVTGAAPWRLAASTRFALATLAVLGVLRFALGRWWVRRIGGYTGDCLGFAQQIFELTIYLMAAAWTWS
jgi:adenosylcobinamide-GDP ribazoletransferase